MHLKQTQGQLDDPASALLTGSTSSALTPNQQPTLQVMVLGGATDASGGGNFASGTPSLGTLKIRVDDQSTYYFNGVELGSTVVSQWVDTVTTMFMAPCGDGSQSFHNGAISYRFSTVVSPLFDCCFD